MTGLRLIFFVGLTVCLFLTFANGYWEAHLRIPERDATYIIDLPRAPTWNPPPLPPYGAFIRDFDKELPKDEPAGTIIKRVANWEPTLINGSLYLWGLTAVAGLLYRLTRQMMRDRILTVVEKIGFGMTGAAVTCILLWLVGGGWGPPMPLFFSFLGLAVGVVWGLLVPFPPSKY